jgi:zinc protease
MMPAMIKRTSRGPRIALFGGVALLLTSPAGAAPPPIEKHVCDNGLTVLVVENHSVPLVTVHIAVKNGSMTESPEYNGLSHLYEHMFFKANKALPSQEGYMARARELGMAWNGTTNTERVNYFFTTTSDHTEGAMVFMRDAIVHPLFDEKELAREREVVVGEIERNLSSPGYHFWHDVQQRVFWKYPSYKNPLGDAKTVRAATRAKMKTIQERYYIPNNSVLVVTGDVKAKDVFAQTDKLYSEWKKGPDPFVKYPLVQHPPIPKSEVVLVEQPVGSVDGQLVWHGPSTVGKDVDLTYAADLAGRLRRLHLGRLLLVHADEHGAHHPELRGRPRQDRRLREGRPRRAAEDEGARLSERRGDEERGTYPGDPADQGAGEALGLREHPHLLVDLRRP